jgi:glycerol-3-phosphate dehydrogenase
LRDLIARSGTLSTDTSSSVTRPASDAQVVVIGAGVLGCAAALALAQRGVAVAVLEAQPEPALSASGTNSGILHTGFDSVPGELETELILASGAIRDRVIAALEIPVVRCGAVMPLRVDSEREQAVVIAAGARRNGVPVIEREGTLEIPGETVTDPVLYTLAIAGAAGRHGAELRMRSQVTSIDAGREELTVRSADGQALRCKVAVNCAGLHADSVARLVGDDSFQIHPRKGEFLVFEPPRGNQLEHILLPVPTKRTKGVLVFPTLDGKIVAGPTAVDQQDKHDWSVRLRARDEILPKARAMYPPLQDAEQIAAYAGLRPDGRPHNYLIGPSRTCARLVNVAAIRSTGLTASLGIAQRVVEIVESLGVELKSEKELAPGPRPAIPQPWWRRAAAYQAGGAA